MTVQRATALEVAAKSSKEDWLKLAIDKLIAEGIAGVKVQLLAKQLGVSRSSFYWFFQDSQDLQDQLLDYWLKRNTGPIIECAMRPAANINKAVCNVFECWIDSNQFDPDLDIAIRFWGRHEDRIRSVLDEADRQRVDALTRMFRRYGYDDEVSETRARVLYYTQIGHFTLQVRESLVERFSHVPSYLVTFTGVEPQPEDVAALKALMTR